MKIGVYPDSTKPKAWSNTGGGFSWQFESPDFQLKTVTQYLTNHNQSSEFPAQGSFNAQGVAYPDLSAVAVYGMK